MEEHQSQDRVADLKKLSLQELEKEVIAFGKAKLGTPFPEAFKDHKWTDSFVSQYEKSPKMEHQKYVMYVEKKMDQEIKAEGYQNKNPVKQKGNGSDKSWSHIKEELGEESAEEWEPTPAKMSGVTTEMAILQDQVNHMFQENQNLNHRMANLEGNMAEILLHLKGLSVQGNP